MDDERKAAVPGTVGAVVRSIDRSVELLTNRLRVKGGMYAPDAEWTACRDAIAALEKAKKTIIELLSPNIGIRINS